MQIFRCQRIPGHRLLVVVLVPAAAVLPPAAAAGLSVAAGPLPAAKRVVPRAATLLLGTQTLGKRSYTSEHRAIPDKRRQPYSKASQQPLLLHVGRDLRPGVRVISPGHGPTFRHERGTVARVCSRVAVRLPFRFRTGNKKAPQKRGSFRSGAKGEIRTLTLLRAPAPQAGASASSATFARRVGRALCPEPNAYCNSSRA